MRVFLLAAVLLSIIGSRAVGADLNIKTVSGAVQEIVRAWNALPDKKDLNVLRRHARSAISGLSLMGPEAVPAIERALYDAKTSPQVKGILCESLIDIPGEAAIELLGKVLGDPAQHRIVRAFAGRAIAKKQGPRADEIVKQAIGDLSLSIEARAELMMNISIRGHDDVDWLAQVAEGKGLGLSSDAGAEIPQDAYALILNAQRALGASKNPRATEVIVAFLEKHPTNDILIEALGKRGDQKAIPVLLKCLGTPTQNMSRQEAARALGHLRAKEAVTPLIGIVLHERGIFEVVAAASALAEIGDKRAVPAMEQLVQNLKTDPRIEPANLAAYEAQAQKGWGPFPPIHKALDQLKKK